MCIQRVNVLRDSQSLGSRLLRSWHYFVWWTRGTTGCSTWSESCLVGGVSLSSDRGTQLEGSARGRLIRLGY